MSNDFTVVLPVRGTEKELKFMDKSIPSAIKLNPGEIIFAVDDPVIPAVQEKITSICKQYNYDKYVIMPFSKDNGWKFQLAYILWNVYAKAKYDKILSFDIDSIVREDVLEGYHIIGIDDIAVYSFTKKLLLKSFLDYQRYFFYRMRVKQTDKPFSGIYWVYRPYFFKIIDVSKYKELVNGVDTFLIESLESTDYKLHASKTIGCDCLDVQNEDYPWRQFQTGIWVYANQKFVTRGKVTPNMKNWRNISLNKLIAYTIMLPISLIMGRPFTAIFFKAIIYGHPYLLSGYRWAQKNSTHEVVLKAKTMSYTEWGYQGGELMKLTGKNFKRADGTGF